MGWSASFTPKSLLKGADRYIKQEEDVEDEADFDSGFQVPLSRNFGLGASLNSTFSYSVHSKRGKQFESVEARLQRLRRTTFETDGMIASTNKRMFIRVSHILVDTGANYSVVSLELVRKARLRMHAIEPKIFHTANGYVSNDRAVYIDLYLAGIHQQIIAYVSKIPDTKTFVLGITDQWLFGLDFNTCCGPREETRLTVFRRETGYRRKKFVLKEADSRYTCTFEVYEYYKGLSMAQEPGETISESNSRGVIERASARYQSAVKKHGHRIKKELRNDYF